MAIVTLFEALLNDIFKAEEKFFQDPKSFEVLENSVKTSTEAFAAGFLGEILSELDQAIYKSGWRNGKYKVQRRDRRRLISSVGDIEFDCTYYEAYGKRKGFCHLLEELIGLERNERFTQNAEVALLTEALKTSYEEATKVLPSRQQITKTTVMNKIHGIAEEIPDTIYETRKAVPYLFIEADEDHVAEQHGKYSPTEENKSFISKLIYIYEMKQDCEGCSGRKELVNKYYFSGIYPGSEGNSKIWSRVRDFIGQNYEEEAIKRIFISGDGAQWIKSGVHFLEKSVFCADKYHLMQYLNAAAAQMLDEKDLVKEELWHLLYSKSTKAKKNFDEYTARMMASSKSPEKVECLRKYVLGNWSAVRLTLRNKIVEGCSAESHVSHVLSDRLSSRPMGWSQTGADRMSKLRCYERNNGRAEIIRLVKYSRNQRLLKATGTDDIPVAELTLRNVLAEHYKQTRSYIDRIQAHIPYGTVKKSISIQERLWTI